MGTLLRTFACISEIVSSPVGISYWIVRPSRAVGEPLTGNPQIGDLFI